MPDDVCVSDLLKLNRTAIDDSRRSLARLRASVEVSERKIAEGQFAVKETIEFLAGLEREAQEVWLFARTGTAPPEFPKPSADFDTIP